jgi:hypothetical protein
MLLSSIMLVPVSFAAAAESGDSVTVKSRFKGSTLSIVVKNLGETEIHSFEVTLTENTVIKFRGPSSWMGEMDGNSVMFDTEDKPIMKGKSKTFKLTLADRVPAATGFEWMAMDLEFNDLGVGNWMYKPSSRDTKITARSTDSLTLSVEKESYSAGEHVVLSGKGRAEAEVIIRVTDSNGHSFAKTEVKPDRDGSFKAEIMLEEAREGTYVAQASQEGATAFAKFMVKGEMMTTTATHTHEGGVQIFVSTDRIEYHPGGVVTIYGRGVAGIPAVVTIFNSEGHQVSKQDVENKYGTFTAKFTLGADALAGRYKVLAEQHHDDKTTISATSSFLVATGSTEVPRLAVATDYEEYKPGSPLLIKVKSSSPGTVTVAIVSPDGRTVFKEEVKTNDLGEAVSDYRIGEDAPAGEWKALAIQGDAEARVGFHVIR